MQSILTMPEDDLAYNQEYHKRVKHIERRHSFVRECVENFYSPWSLM